jgi:hypothetical protein
MHTSFVSKTALTAISVACIAFGTGSALGPSGADAYTGTLPLPPSTSAPTPPPSAEPSVLPVSSVPAAVNSAAPTPAPTSPPVAAATTPAPAAVAPTAPAGAAAPKPAPAVSSKPRTLPRTRSCRRKKTHKAHSKRCLPSSKRRHGAAHPNVGARAASYDWVLVGELLDGNVIDGLNYWFVWEEVNSGALFYSFYECDAGCQYTGDNWILYGDTWYYEASGVWYRD